MRTEFNAFVEAAGQESITFTTVVVASYPAPQAARQGRGSLSQMVDYYVDGRLVAKCHRYLRRDGSVGGSGAPDPKWLMIRGEIWTKSHDDRTRCTDCINRNN